MWYFYDNIDYMIYIIFNLFTLFNILIFTLQMKATESCSALLYRTYFEQWIIRLHDLWTCLCKCTHRDTLLLCGECDQWLTTICKVSYSLQISHLIRLQFNLLIIVQFLSIWYLFFRYIIIYIILNKFFI